MIRFGLEEPLAGFLDDRDDWEREKTSVDGVFVLKLPEYKGNPPRLAIQLNPPDSSGTRRRRRA